MKFATIAKGTRAESELVELPRFSFSMLMRPLTGDEFGDAHAFARTRAESKGAKDPGIGEPIYDLALMAAIVAVGAVDPDSLAEARTPSFSGPEQLLAELHPEEIVYLHERHEVWQNECSPTARKIDYSNLDALAREVAGSSGQATFMRLSPSERVSFSLSMARTLVVLWDSLATRSSSSSGSRSTSRSSARKAKPRGKKPRSVRARPRA